jgi:hypothetical protein
MHPENELALYVEGDLPPAMTSEMDIHLLSCARCRQVVEELRETQSLFKSIRQETVSPQELAHLRTGVLGQIAARPLRPAWGRWVYALAGVGFMVAVGVGIVTKYTRRVPTAAQQVVQRQSAEPRPIERHSPPFPQSASPIGRSLDEGGVAAPPEGEPDRAKPQEMSQAGWLPGDNHVRNHPGAARHTSFIKASPYRARALRERRGMGEPQPPTSEEPPKEIMVKLLTDDPNVVIYWLVDQNGGAL